MTTITIAALALLGWTFGGLLVVHRIQPHLARLALMVLASAIAWPITLAGHRARCRWVTAPDRDTRSDPGRGRS